MNDLKFALRQLRKSPGFTLVAVLALALGIGANSAIFSVVNGVLLRPLSFPEPERLVRLHESNVRLGFPIFSIVPGTFVDWQTENHVFENLAAINSSDFNLTGQDKPERVSAFRVSATLFPILRVRPELGRLFLPEEDAAGRNDVVLLSRWFWQKRFGGHKQMVGKQIRLNGQSRTLATEFESRVPNCARMLKGELHARGITASFPLIIVSIARCAQLPPSRLSGFWTDVR